MKSVILVDSVIVLELVFTKTLGSAPLSAVSKEDWGRFTTAMLEDSKAEVIRLDCNGLTVTMAVPFVLCHQMALQPHSQLTQTRVPWL